MDFLLHDVGNPPINDWFSENLASELIRWTAQDDALNQPYLGQLNHQLRQDLCHFERNAQAIRLVRTLLQLNLSYSQVACILDRLGTQMVNPARFRT